MIGDFFNFLSNGVFSFLNGFLSIFPTTEVNADVLKDYMGVGVTADVLSWVNYFLPLDIASGIIALWATGMLAYLGIKLAMKYTGEII